MQFVKSITSVRETGLPSILSILSLVCSTALKSPNISHGFLCDLCMVYKIDHNSFLSSLVLKAYTKDTIKIVSEVYILLHKLFLGLTHGLVLLSTNQASKQQLFPLYNVSPNYGHNSILQTCLQFYPYYFF